MSTFTYDITDNTGKLRLAISDIDLTTTVGARSDWTVLFTDEELGVFLSQAASNIAQAAAYALRTMAASRALVAKLVRLGDYMEDMKIVSFYLSQMADKYEKQAQSEPSGLAAEVAQTDFTARDIIYNRELRTG